MFLEDKYNDIEDINDFKSTISICGKCKDSGGFGLLPKIKIDLNRDDNRIVSIYCPKCGNNHARVYNTLTEALDAWNSNNKLK